MAEDRSAPEGAECNAHPQRRAFFTCPRCGKHACLICWQDVVDRCHSCIVRDPTAGIEPLPWEDPERSRLGGYFATLATVFHPRKTAAAFAFDDTPAAWRFWLLTVVPLALLAGVIPHTRTLEFGDVFGVKLLGQPSSAAMVFDVVRAAGIQLLLALVELASLALPFASLVKAYGPAGRAHAALRVVLYRAWLLPLAMLVFSLGLWAMPALPTPPSSPSDLPAGFMLFRLFRDLVPVVLLLSMVATARLACGLGPVVSMVVVVVPALVLASSAQLAGIVLQHLLPSP